MDWRDRLSYAQSNEAVPEQEEKSQEQIYAEKLTAALYAFHEYWYLWKNGPEWYVPKEQVDEWGREALLQGNRSLKNMQNHVKDWWMSHNYKDPAAMWKYRVEDDVDVILEGNTNIDNVAEYMWYLAIRGLFGLPPNPKDDDQMFDFAKEKMNEFVNAITYPTAQWLADYLFHGWRRIQLEMGVANYADRNTVDMSQEQLTDLMKNYIKQTGPYEFFEQFEYLELEKPEFQGIIYPVLAKHHMTAIQIWDSKKATHPKATMATFERVSDLVEAQMQRNDAALASQNIDEIATAISLTLNLKHNFGNLIMDHINIDPAVLNDLSNMDTSKLDDILRQWGFDRNKAWGNGMDAERNKETMETQHPYYQQKEVERQQRWEDQDLPQEYRKPWTGGGKDWRNKLMTEGKDTNPFGIRRKKRSPGSLIGERPATWDNEAVRGDDGGSGCGDGGDNNE